MYCLEGGFKEGSDEIGRENNTSLHTMATFTEKGFEDHYVYFRKLSPTPWVFWIHLPLHIDIIQKEKFRHKKRLKNEWQYKQKRSNYMGFLFFLQDKRNSLSFFIVIFSYEGSNWPPKMSSPTNQCFCQALNI